LNLLHIIEFEMSAPQCPKHYPRAGNSDVLDIAVHKNARLSEVTVSDILNSDHLPIVFHLLDHVGTGNLSDPIKNSQNKASRVFTVSIASAYKLLTSKITLSYLNTKLPGLEGLLKHKLMLRKL
jgi:hypothetical protein